MRCVILGRLLVEHVDKSHVGRITYSADNCAVPFRGKVARTGCGIPTGYPLLTTASIHCGVTGNTTGELVC